MSNRLAGAFVLPCSLAVVFLFAGCHPEGEGVAMNEPPPGPALAPPPPGGGPAPQGPGGGPGGSPGIRQIMGKLAKGPSSMTRQIGDELKADPPPWETIQPQTKEYARLAGELGDYEPPKGSKESWDKLTAAWAGAADALDKAAKAKDKAAAQSAHGQLTSSCNACHREHRTMGPGMGGPPRGPGGFGPPPGGPPPGGPPPGGPPQG